MEIHYNINPTMDRLAASFFLKTLPDDFVPVEHRSEVATSGEFAKDGFYDLIAEKIDWVLSVIEARLDGKVMLWSDIDIVFNRTIGSGEVSREIENLSEGRDLLFQREGAWGEECNTGFIAIRRNTRSLIFFSQVRIMLELHHRSEQTCANHLLKLIDGVGWGLLPLSYSSESNRGLDPQSRIYHANCTIRDSMVSKDRLLSRAMGLWSSDRPSASGGTDSLITG